MKQERILNQTVAMGSLILVNQTFSYNAEASTSALVSVNSRDTSVTMTHEAATMLNALMKQIKGWSKIRAVSGFRTKERQQEIWDENLAAKGEAYTNTYVAVPGHSEHHAGLAVDLGLKRTMFQVKSRPFLYEGICKEFRKEMAKFGFVERYPKGKEEITGIGHEPWHFRYVGVPHAVIMEEMNFALEEYLDFLRQYERGIRCFEYKKQGVHVVISFVRASAEETVSFEREENIPYTVSGNNIDGFIITEYVGMVAKEQEQQIA